MSTFFVPGDSEDVFIPSELTRGPWSSTHQHGGPPSALIARAVERRARELGEVQVARVTIELVRPVPIAPLRVTVDVDRPGKKVQLLRASLSADGVEVVRASALSMRTTELKLPPLAPVARGREDEPPPPPESCARFVFPFFKDTVGYHTAIDLRVARGVFGKTPTTVWMRALHPLLPGEELTPLQRVMLFADSGNGVSVVLDTREWTFINPDLTVSLFRMPEGEWIALDAVTLPQPNGVGISDSRLWDRHGPIGRSVQTLIVQKRA